jgi:hypothetical protein
MGFVVVHRGAAPEGWYRQYLRLLSRVLLKEGVSLDRVPRVAGEGGRWLYVWPGEAKAAEFAEYLKERTEDPDWEVGPAGAAPSVGPLRPLRIEVGKEVTSWTFGLEVLTRKALRIRFPGSCENHDVSIWIPYSPDEPARWTKTPDGIRKAVEQVLPILTGLSLEQLSAFGGYEVVDPVTEEVLIPPTPLQPVGGGEGAGGPPEFPAAPPAPVEPARA